MTIKEYIEEEGYPDWELVWDDLYNEDGDIEIINKSLQELGYDGFIGQNSNNIDGLEIVAFNPEQIKEVTNIKPTNNPDIRFSMKDSKGNKLTEQQQEYFKDSKVRDKDGNLLVLYHGSPNNFNVFNTLLAKDKKSKYQLLFGTHFTTNKEIASKYANNKLSPTIKKGNGSKIYESYLNIKNPLDLTDAKIDVVGIYENSELKSNSNKKMFDSISNILTKEEKEKIYY